MQESGQISCKNLASLYARIHCFMQESCTTLICLALLNARSLQ